MLRNACVRADRVPPARVGSASRRRTIAPRSHLRIWSSQRPVSDLRLLCQALFVRPLHVVVLPLDESLGPQLRQILLKLLFALVGEHAVADLLARLFERHR